MKSVILKKVVELSSTKVELAIIDDIMSDVSANGKGMDKARPLIRGAFSDIAKAIEIYQRVQKRSDRLEKDQASFKKNIDAAGLSVGDLSDARMKNAYNGLYTTDIKTDIKALQGAIGALRKTGEV